MRWARNVVYMGEMHTKFWLGSLGERDHSEGLSVDGGIIFKWTLGK
jgi:hypothetical protein